MFCNMCGNKVEDNSIFCNRCGARIDIPVTSAPEKVTETPVNAESIPVANTMAAAGQEAHESEAPSSSSIRFDSKAATPLPTMDSALNPANPIPQPVETARSGWSSEIRITDVPEKIKKGEKPRKYYTGAHLAMCLVTTGIMAMAAGVFAALYFMTVL